MKMKSFSALALSYFMLCSCQAELAAPRVFLEPAQLSELRPDVHQSTADEVMALEEKCQFKFHKEQTLKEVFIVSGLMKSVCGYEESEIHAVYSYIQSR